MFGDNFVIPCRPEEAPGHKINKKNLEKMNTRHCHPSLDYTTVLG